MRKFFAHPVRGRADERTHVRSLISAADETKVATAKRIPGSSKILRTWTMYSRNRRRSERRNYTQYFIIYLFYIRWLIFFLSRVHIGWRTVKHFRSEHRSLLLLLLSSTVDFISVSRTICEKCETEARKQSHFQRNWGCLDSSVRRLGVNAQKARKFARNIWTRHCPRSLAAIKCRKTVHFMTNRRKPGQMHRPPHVKLINTLFISHARVTQSNGLSADSLRPKQGCESTSCGVVNACGSRSANERVYA